MNLHSLLFLFMMACFGEKILAQNEWTGCVDPRNPTNSRVKIGDPTPVCLTVGPGGSWSRGVPYIRWMFTPKADEYSRFRIPNSYIDLVRDGNSDLAQNNLTVHAASHSQLSWLRVYWDQDANRLFPFLTAIIDLDNGRVTGIAWDDSCVFCSGGRCVENTYDFDGSPADEQRSGAPSKGCYFVSEECNTIEGASEDVDCDILLYVVWTGTDADGKAMQSSANRFSNFSPAKLQDRAKSLLPDLPSLPDVPNPF